MDQTMNRSSPQSQPFTAGSRRDSDRSLSLAYEGSPSHPSFNEKLFSLKQGPTFREGFFKHILVLFICFIPFLHANTTSNEQKRQIEDLKKHVCDALPFDGWCSKQKAGCLIDLVMEVNPAVYVEIGVYAGRSLFPVASALKFLGKGVIIGIDPWDKEEMIKYFDTPEYAAISIWWSNINYENIYYSYLNMLKKFELEEYCITMKTTSKQAASEVIYPIDILYIDGNPSETCSTQDVLLYLPLVRPGGYIYLNDILWPTKQRAAELLLQSCEIVRRFDNGNCVLFKKR